MINLLRLLWIEGSLDPHKAKGHHEPSHIGPLIEVASEERKGLLLKPTDFSMARKPWGRSMWFPLMSI